MDVDSARDDLAFLRALVAPEDNWQQQFGRIYAAAGGCYSVQMAMHIGQLFGLLPGQGPWAQVVGWAPTAVFVGILLWVVRRGRGAPVGTTSKAVGAAFGAVGLSNLALCLSFGSVALRLHSETVWRLYPCVVMILQGLAWSVAYMMRRRAWLGGVAIGWFATGVTMAAFITDVPAYVAAATVGVVGFMLAPGLYLMRQAGARA